MMFPTPRPVVLILFTIVIATILPGAAQTRPAASSGLLPGESVIQYLNKTIDWYRRVVSLEQSSTDSQELLLRSALQQNARQAVQLTLRFARAEAAIMDTAAKSAPAGGAGGRGRTVQQAAADAEQRAALYREQIAGIDAHIAAGKSDSLDLLYARRYELIAQQNLANTQRDVLQEYASFMVSAENGDGTNLVQKIDELERSLPELRADAAKSAAGQSASSQGQAFQPENVGIFGLVSEMMRLSNRMGEVNRLGDDATALHAANDKLRQPMRDGVIDTMRSSQATTAAIATTQSDDPIALESRGMEIDVLTDRFKQIASVSIPLAEQNVMIDAARESLLEWHQTLGRQYTSAMRSLVLRLGTVIGTILVIFFISEVWRRATFRYISDARRQRQIMLVRRLVVGLIIVIIVAVSVVSEFGSIATFAGLITAGVAVALQTVILSGVAYFFFIGRFGVRVGDRVTITNITGDVIEIGLFRIYLMELGGTKPDLHPTGRIVVFSNSVLFQNSAFYKQLPGSDYIWREVALTLAAGADYTLTEKRLMDAVNHVFGDYREIVESQHAQISKSLHVDIGRPVPEGRLRFVENGLEFVVRYPVDLHQAAKIDDRITRELIAAINQEPKLQLVGAMPVIRPA